MYGPAHPGFFTRLIIPAYLPGADRLATVAILFLEKYSGTYRTCDALRAQIEIYLEKQYPHDLTWLNREKDLEGLVDFVKNAGGIVIGKYSGESERDMVDVRERSRFLRAVEFPPLPGRGVWGVKTAEIKAE